MREKRGQLGIGMIEFMVALLLLTIVIVGTMSLQLTALRASSDSRYTSGAMILAQSSLESFRSAKFPGITCSGSKDEWFDVNSQLISACATSTSCSAASVFFSRNTALAATAVGAVTGCRATVTVSWATSQGTQQVVQTLDRMP